MGFNLFSAKTGGKKGKSHQFDILQISHSTWNFWTSLHKLAADPANFWTFPNLQAPSYHYSQWCILKFHHDNHNRHSPTTYNNIHCSRIMSKQCVSYRLRHYYCAFWHSVKNDNISDMVQPRTYKCFTVFPLRMESNYIFFTRNLPQWLFYSKQLFTHYRS